jgi:uncharacterized protein YbaP (TraB family)
MRAVLVAAAVAGGCATASCPPSRYQAPVDRRPFLWRVAGARGQVTLFGTVHAAGKRDIPGAALDALRGSSLFVAELPPLDGERVRELAALPPGESLQRLLGDGPYGELRAALAGQVDEQRLARARPWYAMSLLTSAMIDAPDVSMDAALLDLARRRALRVSFLETPEEQLGALAASVTADDLRQAIAERGTMRCSVVELVAAYRAGDGATIRADLAGATASKLLDERNARWLPAVEDFMEDRAFIAVGVSHLVGPGSLPELLAARGHQVTRLGP